MGVTRRDVLKGAGGAALGTSLIDWFAGASEAEARAGTLFSQYKQTYTVCPYCGVGCGIICHTKDGKLVNTEGDPDHPVNEGALCSKGSALFQVAENERRLTKVRYRAPGSDEWEEKSWDWALPRIAGLIKKTRDATFRKTDKDGKTVNRTEGIACLGGAALDNEECYLYSKLVRALGIVHLEHQARLCHSSTVASLAASFGRGAMTNHFVDMMNADVVMIMGSNAASCHPIAARWIQKAKDKGAILLVADPRYTRTAAYGDVYVKFRSGTDIAFVNGIINYALQNDYIHKEYVVNYTDASFIVAEGYGFHDGLFTGYNPEKREYDKDKVKEFWSYELDADGLPKKDTTLQHPRCVYQLMKKHFSRYDMETVCNITGTPIEDYRKVCEHYTSTWAPNRVGTWLYAMGSTQSTHGTQNIRTYAILQLLLGNIGRAGGGVNAMRGESNVQGSTDQGLLFHLLPGYLKCPTDKEQTLADYIDHFTPKSVDPKSANWWQNTPKYLISLLKAWYGDKAVAGNEFCFNYLPKATGNLSHIPLFEAMYEGKLKGLFILGQNPAVGGPNVQKERKALENLEWLVAADLFETETATFWKRPGVDPKSVKTEVFLLPACSSVEKEGSVTGSGRWAQWRYQAIHPVGESRSDLRIVDELCKALKKEYAKGGTFPDPVLDLTWDYGSGEEPDPHLVAREINGRFLADADFPEKKKSFKKGQQSPAFGFLKDDGSTACGCWIYCGSYTDDGNMMARRDKTDTPHGIGLFPNWAWCWPVNRRILYNRASVDPQGRPWDPKRWVIRWNPVLKDGKGDWEGDVPDGPWPPGDKHPYIMVPTGHAQLFAASLKDGPFPEHYEPLESPIKNPMSSVQFNPAIKVFEPEKIGDPKEYPVIATTFRMAEHWQAGAMTRNIPWLVELVPDMFIQIGRTLAERLGVSTGDKVVVRSARGSMEAYALVSSRLEAFNVDGKIVDQIAIPWHFGFAGLATGDSANNLTSHVGDANTTIPEYKVFLCNVTKKEVA